MRNFIIITLLSLVSCVKPCDTKDIVKKKTKFFFIGDSMTSGDTASYPFELKQLFKDSSGYQFKNHAVSGVGISQMNSQAQNIIFEKDNTMDNVVVVLGCINNISFNGMTGNECYSQISLLHSTLRNNGFRTIGISLTSRRQLAYFSELQSQYFWTQIVQANTAFSSNLFCDKYLDLQQISGFSGYEAATDSPYFSDGCHFSDAGKKEIAKKLFELWKTL